MNGPVPLALRTAKVSCLALKSCGAVTSCFSLQALLIMPTSHSFSGSTASGAASWTSMVSASSLRTPVMPRNWLARCEVFISARWSENTASSALNAAPSWNLTFGRRRKRQVVGVGLSQDTASAGSVLKLRSRLTRLSWTCVTTREWYSSASACGSRLCGSKALAKRSVLASAGPATRRAQATSSVKRLAKRKARRRIGVPGNGGRAGFGRQARSGNARMLPGVAQGPDDAGGERRPAVPWRPSTTWDAGLKAPDWRRPT